MSSAAAFRAFEHSGWETSVSAYDRYFGPLTCETTDALLDAAPGHRLLDVATGPGYVAISAHSQGREVEGIDFSPVMIEVARRNARRSGFASAMRRSCPTKTRASMRW